MKNIFQVHTLTPEEEKSASKLTHLQKMYFQNMLSFYAMQKVNLTMDMTNIHGSLQTEAELQGQILLLQSILETSDTVEN